MLARRKANRAMSKENQSVTSFARNTSNQSQCSYKCHMRLCTPDKTKKGSGR